MQFVGKKKILKFCKHNFSLKAAKSDLIMSFKKKYLFFFFSFQELPLHVKKINEKLFFCFVLFSKYIIHKEEKKKRKKVVPVRKNL